jgi:hypothetical protein
MSVRLSALRTGRSLTAGRDLLLISLRGWDDPRSIVSRLSSILIFVQISRIRPSAWCWFKVNVKQEVLGRTKLLPNSDRKIHKPTDIRVQEFFYCCVYSFPQERVKDTLHSNERRIHCSEPLPNDDSWDTLQTYRPMGGWDGFRCHDIYTKFHKECFIRSKINTGGFTVTKTALRWHKPTLGK